MPSSRSLTLEQVLTVLAQTPPRIAELTASLTPAQLHTAPRHGEWSVNDVLAHLRSCADVWGDCIALIMEQDAPTIRAVNPTTWIKSTDYPEQKFKTSLRAFTAQRIDLLAILETLTPQAWSRTATVTGAGKPLERTLHGFAQRLARHERPHLKQIERIVNTIRM